MHMNRWLVLLGGWVWCKIYYHYLLCKIFSAINNYLPSWIKEVPLSNHCWSCICVSSG